MSKAIPRVSVWVAGLCSVVCLAPAAAFASTAFLNRFHTISTLASAVPPSGPAAGDQNPYGVAVVPKTSGALHQGNILVSNFNNTMNFQGTGTSIVQVTPDRHASVFAIVPQPTPTPAVGLTTALSVFRNGDVVVGSLPAPGGAPGASGAGALTILNSTGQVIENITGGDINGPWDMTAVDNGSSAVLFVTNVLNGTVAAHGQNVSKGTVVRLRLAFAPARPPVVTAEDVIATGFVEHTDPSALVVGPTGVSLGANGTLYVADSFGNRVAAVPNALTRTTVLGGGGVTVSKGGKLKDPLGLTVVPGGDIVTMNGGDGNAVETTPAGQQVATKTLVANGAGTLFGDAVAPGGTGLYFVNDSGSGPAANSLQLLH